MKVIPQETMQETLYWESPSNSNCHVVQYELEESDKVKQN